MRRAMLGALVFRPCYGFAPRLLLRRRAATLLNDAGRGQQLQSLSLFKQSRPPSQAYDIPKELFNRTLRIVAVRVPKDDSNCAATALSSDLLDLPRIKRVVPPDGDRRSGERLVLLGDHVTMEHRSLKGLSEKSMRALRARGHGLLCGCSGSGDEAATWSPEPYDVALGWEHVTVAEALRRLLPADVEDGAVPSSFEVAGHVAHLNLRDELLPHRFLVGAVVLDKNPRLASVVNKVGAIECTFRTFDFELLAGRLDLNVEIVESGCTFRFDYSKVYWNSRLQEEHRRILGLIAKGDIVCDLFAGVGPFAVPAACRRGAAVLANDLNPSSAAALRQAVEVNGGRLEVRDSTSSRREEGQVVGPPPPGTVRSFNLDAAEFVAAVVSQGVLRPDHVIMNLPAMGPDFLPALDPWRKAIVVERRKNKSEKKRENHEKSTRPVRVHCYCFVVGSDPLGEAVATVKSKLSNSSGGDRGGDGASDLLDVAYVHEVRSVAPMKTMVCVGFDLPPLT